MFSNNLRFALKQWVDMNHDGLSTCRVQARYRIFNNSSLKRRIRITVFKSIVNLMLASVLMGLH